MSIVEENTPKPKFSFRNFREWFNSKASGEWFKDMKTNISLTASIIATMTFALATNPPGGVVQADVDLVGNHYCKSVHIPYNPAGNITILCAGQALMGSIPYYRTDYLNFLAWDTICFFAAITIIFILVSGLPLDYKATMSILSISILLSLVSLAYTFVFAAKLVTPDSIWNSYGNVFFVGPVVYTFILVIVYICHVVAVFSFVRVVNATNDEA